MTQPFDIYPYGGSLLHCLDKFADLLIIKSGFSREESDQIIEEVNTICRNLNLTIISTGDDRKLKIRIDDSYFVVVNRPENDSSNFVLIEGPSGSQYKSFHFYSFPIILESVCQALTSLVSEKVPQTKLNNLTLVYVVKDVIEQMKPNDIDDQTLKNIILICYDSCIRILVEIIDVFKNNYHIVLLLQKIISFYWTFESCVKSLREYSSRIMKNELINHDARKRNTYISKVFILMAGALYEKIQAFRGEEDTILVDIFKTVKLSLREIKRRDWDGMFIDEESIKRITCLLDMFR